MMILDGYTIRLAKLRDADEIFRIWWAAKAEIGVNTSQPEHKYLDLWRSYCLAENVWMAQLDNSPVGLIYMVGNELFYLVTAEQHRGKGIGQALISRAKSVALERNYSMLTAKTKPTNAATKMLLQRTGFVEMQDGPDPNETWIHYEWKTGIDCDE